jgi:hypothetical protein
VFAVRESTREEEKKISRRAFMESRACEWRAAVSEQSRETPTKRHRHKDRDTHETERDGERHRDRG